MIWTFGNTLFIYTEGVMTILDVQCGIKLDKLERELWVCEDSEYDVHVCIGFTSYELHVLNFVVTKSEVRMEYVNNVIALSDSEKMTYIVSKTLPP
jgi:hypothetical protein